RPCSTSSRDWSGTHAQLSRQYSAPLQSCRSAWARGAMTRLAPPVSAAPALFLQQPDTRDLHAAIGGFEHVVDSQRGDAGGGECFHFNAGLALATHARDDAQRARFADIEF